MTVEVIGGWLAKLGWTALIPYLIWDHKRGKVRLENTLSKKETVELIDLKLSPMQKELTLKIDTLVEAYSGATAQRKETQDLLQHISLDVAVVKSEVENIKERLNNKGA